MITPEQHAEIRRLYFGEHWKVGTIAAALGVHHDTVRAAIADTHAVRRGTCRPTRLDPYLPFVRDTLALYPRLRATRLYEMVRARGYAGSVVQLRRVVRTLRPQAAPTIYRRLTTLMGEEAQVDWGAFGTIRIGHGTRPLSGFVMVLSYSRALSALFTLDQTLESFLRGHVDAFHGLFAGVARTLVYDNLRSAVLERQGSAVRFHPRLLELAGHYHFAPRPCTPGRGNEKGKIERQIQYLRHAFFAARTFTDVDDLNSQFRRWRDEIAHQRPHPEQRDQSVAQIFAQEQPRLLPLPAHPFETDVLRAVVSGKTAYVRFDRNSYSIPHMHVRRPLTLVASATTVRLVAGTEEIARHPRSYDSGQTIEHLAHLDGLLAATRQANPSTGRDRLRLAVPAIATLFERLAVRGESLRAHTARLLALLDDYGPRELAVAVTVALARDALGAGAIAHLLETRRRQRGQPPLVPLALPDRPGVRDLDVTPHRLETYDAFSRPDPDDDSDR
jgi:transposase